MKGLALRWFTSTLSILMAAYLVDGITVSGFFFSFFRRSHAGYSQCIFQTGGPHPDPAHQPVDSGPFHLCHQRADAEDGLRSHRRPHGGRFLARGLRLRDHQCCELADEYLCGKAGEYSDHRLETPRRKPLGITAYGIKIGGKSFRIFTQMRKTFNERF